MELDAMEILFSLSQTDNVNHLCEIFNIVETKTRYENMVCKSAYWETENIHSGECLEIKEDRFVCKTLKKYNDNGLLYLKKSIHPHSNMRQRMEYWYDDCARLVRVQSVISEPFKSDVESQIDYIYENGLLVRVIQKKYDKHTVGIVYKYDKNNCCVSKETIGGSDVIYQYDEERHLTRCITDGKWVEEYMYNDDYDKISYICNIDPNSNESSSYLTYDDDGNLIEYWNTDNGYRLWMNYEKAYLGPANLINICDNKCRAVCFAYNGDDNLVWIKKSNGEECRWEYDEHGRLIHFKDNYNNEIWRKYKKELN